MYFLEAKKKRTLPRSKQRALRKTDFNRMVVPIRMGNKLSIAAIYNSGPNAEKV